MKPTGTVSSVDVPDGHAPLIPDYRLLRKIGGGGYGEVWLGRSATGVLRAVKVVWRAKFENERPFNREFEGIQKFERLSREHPSQLALFHVGRNEDLGYFYYVMELADNIAARDTEVVTKAPGYKAHTLRADLQNSRLSAEKVLELALALTEALGRLHTNGLVHRDVKPSNIIFVDSRPKLADIGLVTEASDARSIVGTEGYLPPEGPGTPQADLFALGKVLYETTTGLDRRLFPQLPPDLRSWPDCSLVFELNEIFLKAAAEDPKTRYLTAEQMRADLLLLQSGKSPKRYHAIERRLAVATKAGVILALVTILVAAVLFETMRQRNRATRTAVRLHVSNGTRLMNEGDYFGSLLSFAEALRLDSGSAAHEEPHRIRIASVLQQCPKLAGVFTHEADINSVAFSPDCLSASTAANDQRAKVWDISSGKLRFELPHKGPVYSVSFSSDNRFILTSSTRAQIWDAANGQWLIRDVKSVGHFVRPQPRFAPDSKRFLTLVDANTAQLWELPSGHPIGAPLQHDARLTAFAFSFDSQFVATVGEDQTVRVWTTAGGDLRWAFPHSAGVIEAAFTRDNLYLATTGEDRLIRFWDLVSGQLSPPSIPYRGGIRSLSFSPDGERFVGDGYNKTAPVWNTFSRAATGLPIHQEIAVRSAIFSPDARRILTTGGNKVHFWDPETLELIPPVLPHSDWREPAVISDDGRLVATFEKGEARVWNFAVPEPAPMPIRSVGFFEPKTVSPDGRFRAMIGGDNILRVMEIDSANPLSQPITEASSIRQAFFGPESQVLATEREDTRCRFWQVATGDPLTPLLKSRYVLKEPRITQKDLPHDSKSAADLISLAQLLSGRRIDQTGGFQPVEPAESLELWNALKTKYPENFGASTREAIEWERQTAHEAEQSWNWWTARFHLSALLAMTPSDESLRQELDYVKEALSRVQQKSADHESRLPIIPPRSRAAPPETIDLSPYYNMSIKQIDPSIPCGIQTFAGIKFDVRGVLQLQGLAPKRLGISFLDKVEGIQVGRTCRKVHFLQAAQWDTVKGTHIASYLIHYGTNQTHEIRVVFGRDVANFWTSSSEELKASSSQLAWVGSSPAVQNESKCLRMFKTSWENPHPDDTIERIDFFSQMSEAAPFVVAITVE